MWCLRECFLFFLLILMLIGFGPDRRRTQMGLVVGFVLNLLFGWWRLMLDGS